MAWPRSMRSPMACATTSKRRATRSRSQSPHVVAPLSRSTRTERPMPIDPRTLEDEQVGTKLRDGAVDPKVGDFLGPSNAGEDNPHGPTVVNPGPARPAGRSPSTARRRVAKIPQRRTPRKTAHLNEWHAGHVQPWTKGTANGRARESSASTLKPSTSTPTMARCRSSNTLRATHRLDQKGRRVPRALRGHRAQRVPTERRGQKDHADQLAPMALTARQAQPELMDSHRKADWNALEARVAALEPEA